jgi:hypothetical protein
MEFNSISIAIYPKDEAKTMHICVTRDTRVAAQLNRILKHYPAGTRFKEGEEPRFVFHTSQIKRIGIECPILGRIFAQVNK